MVGAGSGLAIGWLTGKVSEAVIAKWGTGPAFTSPPRRERPPAVGDFVSFGRIPAGAGCGKGESEGV